MSEPIFYLDIILEGTSDEHPPVLYYQGGQTEEAPPAGATGAMLKETELGNSLMRGLIHVA